MAADEGHEAADAAVESFLRDARQTYREAQDDAGRTLRSFLAGFEAEDAERRADVAAGRLAEDEYREWRRGRMLTGRRYRATLDQVAWCYTHANEVAMAALSGRLPEVFAENYNYGTYQVEAAALVDTTFALQDASTAQTLIADSDAYLPKLKVDEERDRAWNRRLVSSQLAQGVALGEGIPDIAARIARVTGSNVAAATRAARTSVTAAECAGRVESYRRAQGMGVRLGQEWLATLDERTRSSHRQLDGERVEVGGKFSNGCRYPGDPAAPYAETCNCRCTLVAAVDGVDQSGAKRWSRLPEGMTYEQWKATKPAVSGPVPANRTISEFMDMPGTRRRLDAAGVSATEARRLLTAQLRDYGIPSGSFRKMSAGDQQSVLDGALTRISGAVSGALDDSNDPGERRRFAHAVSYYEEVRKRDAKLEVQAVAQSSGFSADKVRTAYEHVFVKEHDLSTGRHRFDPDYDMAQSWQRLREGKIVFKHDLTLIEHEAREAGYMASGMSYEEAHIKTCMDGYNYMKDLEEWKAAGNGDMV